MTIKVVVSFFAALVFSAALLTGTSPAQANVTPQEARKIAKEAYIFNFSLVMMYRTMYIQAINTKSKSYSGGFGKWLHLGMSTPKDTDIVSPNNDTPYSWAWVDLRAEPWVLTMPKIEEKRFYTSQWDDLWGFVLDNPGSIDDGNGGVSVLLAAPDWKGDLPEGIKRVVQGETDFLGTLTRTQAFSAKDLPNVQKIQKEYKLQPLSAYLGKAAPKPAPEIKWMEWKDGDETTDKFWSYVNFLLPYTTPNDMDKDVYTDMSKIGLEPGKQWDASKLDKDIADAITAGMKDARDHLKKESTTFTDASVFFRSRKDAKDDYDNRALGVYVGIFGNIKKVSVYIALPTDSKGALFDGSKASYELKFTKDQLPPAKYFWSMTMYKLPQRWLTANPIKRYSIGSVTPGVQTGKDGSLTIEINAKSPGKDKESNWLPAPSGPFWLVMRTYGPGKSILDKTYKVPPITPVK
jgi:hypothetical protein